MKKETAVVDKPVKKRERRQQPTNAPATIIEGAAEAAIKPIAESEIKNLSEVNSSKNTELTPNPPINNAIPPVATTVVNNDTGHKRSYQHKPFKHKKPLQTTNNNGTTNNKDLHTRPHILKTNDKADSGLSENANNEVINDNNNTPNVASNEIKPVIPAEPKKIIDLQEFRALGIKDLVRYAESLGLDNVAAYHKQEIIYKILENQSEKNYEIYGEGIFERLPEGFGFLRSAKFNYVPGPDDLYISPVFIKKFGLRTGDLVKGILRSPREGEKYFALQRIESVNKQPPYSSLHRNVFENLTPIFPNSKFNLEGKYSSRSTRIMDLFCPIGRGQRGLIVSPPKTGKTVFLKELANSILANNAGIEMIILLIDERPEEVTDMQRSVNAEVVSSTFDENASRHVQVAEIVIEKAKRMVECGQDVVIILDSITRLARAYNTLAPPSGKVLSGGIDANALHRPKRFFGAARNVEEGGSLTIIGSALIETGSKMDDVIYEEFKGTGNMEVHLTRKLSNKRTYPAFDIHMSGTRRDDLLVDETTLKNMWILQKFLSSMGAVEAMELVIDKIDKSNNNQDFWDMMNKKKA